MWCLDGGIQRLSSSRPSFSRELRHQTSWPPALPQGCHHSSSQPRGLNDSRYSSALHATNYAGEQAPAAYSSTSTARSYLQDGQETQQVLDHTVQHPHGVRSRHQGHQQPPLELLTQDNSHHSSSGATAGHNGHITAGPHVLEQQQQAENAHVGGEQPHSHINENSRSSSRQHNGRQKGVQQYQQDTPQQKTRRQQQGSQHHQHQQQHSSRSPKRPGRHKAGGNSMSHNEVASRQLTAAISSSSSWQQLHHLLLQDSSNMNHIHACALLTTTSKLVQYNELCPQEQQQFAEYYVSALQLAFSKAQSTAGPREVSSMLWAVAKVGLHPGPDWLSAYLQASAIHTPQMNAQDMGLLVWALARFRYVPEPQWQQQLLQLTQQKIQRFDGQGFCNLLWGIATLDLKPSRSWLAAAVAAAEQLMPRFQPQGLASVLWAVAKLRHQPQQQWLQAAVDAAAAKLHSFKPAELAMLCHSLAKLHYKALDSSSSSGSSRDSSQATDCHSEQQQQHFLQHVQEISVHSLQRLRFAEAANMVWALGVLDQQPQQQWLSAAVRQLQSTMQHADGKALANACYGLARMRQCPDQQFWDRVWEHIPRVAGRVPQVQQQSDAASVAAAAAPREDASWPSSDHLGTAAAGNAAASTVDTADAQAIATLLMSLAKLGFVRSIPHHISAILLDSAQRYLQQQAMNAAEVSAVAMAAAKCKLQPQRAWFEALDQSLLLLVQRSLGQQQQQQQSRQLAVQRDPLYSHSSSSSSSAGHVGYNRQEPGPEQQQQCEQGRHSVIKPKEVCNTLIGMTKLRWIPSPELLHAVQQYQQQYGDLFNEVDRPQLKKALQSLGDQQRAAEQKAAITAVLQGAAASGTVQECDTAAAQQPHDSSSNPSSNGCHHCCLEGGREDLVPEQQLSSTADSSESEWDVVELPGNAVGSSTGSNSSSSSDQDRTLKPYGRYVLRFATAQRTGLWHQGQAADMVGSQDDISSSSRGRSKSLASAMQQAMLAGRGLSVAAG